jgi:hypothetical protein
VWLIWRRRRRAAVPIVAWLAAGVATLYAGWPWLWLAPIGNLSRYVLSGAQRSSVHVFYLGRVWNDTATPWHYPLVMFLVALPLGLLVLGALGVFAECHWRLASALSQSPARCQHHPPAAKPQPEGRGGPSTGEGLLLGTLVWVLAVFALPGVPVYDGVRLILVAFPLWAVFVGVGAQWLYDHPRWHAVRLEFRAAVLALAIASQGVGLWLYAPCWTSHYSGAIGGLPGAVRLGFEPTYWGDSVRPPMLRAAARVAPGDVVLLAPSLASFQLAGVQMSEPALERARTRIEGWEPSWDAVPSPYRWAIVYRRRADLGPVEPLIRRGEVVAEYAIQGVWLTRLVKLPARQPPRPDALGRLQFQRVGGTTPSRDAAGRLPTGG